MVKAIDRTGKEDKKEAVVETYVPLTLKDLKLNKKNQAFIFNTTADFLTWRKDSMELKIHAAEKDVSLVLAVVNFYERIRLTESCAISNAGDKVSKLKRARLTQIATDILGISYTQFASMYSLGKAIVPLGWAKVEKDKLVISLPPDFINQLSDKPDMLFVHAKTLALKDSIRDAKKATESEAKPDTFTVDYTVEAITDEYKTNAKTGKDEKTSRKVIILKDKDGRVMEKSVTAKEANDKYQPGKVFRQTLEKVLVDGKESSLQRGALKDVSADYNSLTDRLALVSTDLRLYREQLEKRPERIHQPLSRIQFESMLSEIKLILSVMDSKESKKTAKAA